MQEVKTFQAEDNDGSSRGRASLKGVKILRVFLLYFTLGHNRSIVFQLYFGR